MGHFLIQCFAIRPLNPPKEFIIKKILITFLLLSTCFVLSACSSLPFGDNDKAQDQEVAQEVDYVEAQADFCKGWVQGIKMIKGNHIRETEMPKCPRLVKLDPGLSAFREGLKAGRAKASFRGN
ncbi:MAG: hypothetical protein V7699_01020 [Porticoccus sp.]